MSESTLEAYQRAVKKLFPGSEREKLLRPASLDDPVARSRGADLVRKVLEQHPDQAFVSSSEASVYLGYSAHHIQRLRGKKWPGHEGRDWKKSAVKRVRRLGSTESGEGTHNVVHYRMGWLRSIRARIEKEQTSTKKMGKDRQEQAALRPISTLKDAQALLAFLMTKDGKLVCPISVAGLTEEQWKSITVTCTFVSLQDAVTQHLWLTPELRIPWAEGYSELLTQERALLISAQAMNERAHLSARIT